MSSNKINSIINIDLHIHSIYSAYKEEKMILNNLYRN